MAMKQFKAESKKLLDLMINSIYTHKEIFLRELISNASDAIDKLYYKSLVEKKTGIKRSDFEIRLEPNKDERTLTISDNGIGMGKDELEKNLGTIARSGSMDFKEGMEDAEKKKDVDIIGQFGVGFYSAFMVADDIKVYSKAFGESEGHLWESKGSDGYTITAAGGELPTESSGTKIIIKIKENSKDENYDAYLDWRQLKSLVKKYSDYIRFPIKMNVEKTKTPDEKDEKDEKGEAKTETYFEDEILNSQVPIWKRAKKDVGDEDYNNYYKEKFFDFENPLKVITTSVEGVVSYSALLYLPARPPFDYYTKEYEKGLALYSSGVMIMEKCAELVPDYFSFVKGVVDSDDLSLNISRELLQHDRQLLAIAQRLEKKIDQELKKMIADDRENYEKLFTNFGLQFKYGIYEGYGQNKDKLKDYLVYRSSAQKENEKKEMTTIAEYVSRMKEDQKYIYYAIAETAEKAARLPGAESLKDADYEILYMTDDIDDFVMKILVNYDGKEFKSVTAGDLEAPEKDGETEKISEENKGVLNALKTALDGKVSDVRFSSRLKETPVIIVSGDGLSLEMEKVLAKQPGADAAGFGALKAQRILEINPKHAIVAKLKDAAGDEKLMAKYANILYAQALLIEGLEVDDPVALANDVLELV